MIPVSATFVLFFVTRKISLLGVLGTNRCENGYAFQLRKRSNALQRQEKCGKIASAGRIRRLLSSLLIVRVHVRHV